MEKFKHLIGLFLVFMLFGSALQANDLSLDKAKFKKDFQQLNKLEAHVNSHPEVTYREVKAKKPELLKGIQLSRTKTGSALADDGFSLEDMEWGPFAWGFCCAPIGFFVVAIDDDRSDNEKLSFWIGVVVSAVVYSTNYFLWF